MSYLVTYDLRKSNYNDRADDYERLYNALGRYAECARVTESSFVIKTFKSIDVVFSEIKAVLGYSDALFIAELSGDFRMNNCIDPSYKIREAL